LAMLVGWRPKFNDPTVASVRFRCLTPLEELRRQSFPVEVFVPDHEEQYSLVVFSKLYGDDDLKLARSLSKRAVKTALDLSDNHFYNPLDLLEYKTAGDRLREMMRAVDRVICCSPHLASIASREGTLRRPPLVVGDAVENLDLPLSPASAFVVGKMEPFRILWFGSHGSPNAPSGMEDLLRVRRHLEMAERERRTELVVVSNNRAKYDELKAKLNVPSRYVEWGEASFARELVRANAAIIPIGVNPFTKCKSNNRLATALWYGVPAIADRIPAYDELRSFAFVDDWEAGMRHCLAGSREAQLRTAAGSAYVRNRFNIREIAAQWRQTMLQVINET
jgi:hypothetical protein